MEYREFSAKNVDDAITEACETFTVTSDKLDYEVISAGSTGFLGINSKPAVIKARVKEENEVLEKKAEDFVEVKKASEKKTEEVKANNTSVDSDDLCKKANEFLKEVFEAMKMEVSIETKFNQQDKILDVELNGPEMGVLIGKRGQTLDSLQYLISLVVNRGQADYIHVKVDTENYRERRKATLENLAKNISYKVRKSRQSVALEPMNPYERRIIHSALQNDRYVTTHSEGEEPFRRVVVTLKK
ncbi:spoIIIJ-associated protein [Butyrivibrio proteoclasticus]|uniref:RNA-binding protein KhpB n=1 Tax=Butyrivibrio proteoclasticus TaxID=43305 RepID=A0A1I5TWZ1_9FIRM|nr:RNA-binding cell elongation regulator Jag/EloR [Butyrivibrio proteoclasticus]SFP87600.1 spoIIIJ-associated protein [Butyrivibrio proteoclasticus]